MTRTGKSARLSTNRRTIRRNSILLDAGGRNGIMLLIGVREQ